ncbi:hypothetical protein [Streptomyces zagrosensis]|uniref:PRC-barrel domain-containing protein n=1 Tax=Streptomyces zagrosensis TaxID=1042984 RepID=A0A7W9UYK4_9ACTN|nr:hypothetical protein [Streptomyces zagrosensis]MBB5934874.1 hypothetical protein [Streptomyces zagrosensis]
MVTVEDIGKRVEDDEGRVGILRDVIPDYEDPAELPWRRRKQPIAFLGPEQGGREWLVPPGHVERLETQA